MTPARPRLGDPSPGDMLGQRAGWQKSLAVFLYWHGVSMNALAKMFGVWASTILTWIRRHAADHAEQPTPSGKAIVLEIDEMWHFLKKRRKRWIWKARDRDPGPSLTGSAGVVMRQP